MFPNRTQVTGAAMAGAVMGGGTGKGDGLFIMPDRIITSAASIGWLGPD